MSFELNTDLLRRSESSVRIRVSPLPAARTLWSGTPRGARAAASAAVMITEADNGSEPVIDCWADRYGGTGLTHNGGAGRGAVIGNEYVKGIGRTPLVGLGPVGGASDGFLFLEEAARECVLGSILAVEAPWGGVPPIAVIDTGLRPELEYRNLPKFVNHAAVVVRENVLRPAHFERAPLYRTVELFSGVVDEGRVVANIADAQKQVGRDRFLSIYMESWFRWAEQFAYQFVHRISQSLPSSSNLALDGRLLDFGAARSQPDWSVRIPGPGLTPFGMEFIEILTLLRAGGADVFSRIASDEDLEQVLEYVRFECIRRHERIIAIEVLRLAGFRRATAEQWVSSPANQFRLEAAIRPIMAPARRRYSYDVHWPADDLGWLFIKLWSDNPASALRPLRDICETISVSNEPVKERALMRGCCRPDLNYDNFHLAIHSRLGKASQTGSSSTTFDRFVSQKVVSNRRDARVEPRHARPRGFLMAEYQSFAVFSEEGVDLAAKELGSGPIDLSGSI